MGKKFVEFQGHPKGAWFLITTVMWEFFSYYGMRALLVLYLSQKLLFSDSHAYSLYGAYTSLISVTPIIGGYIADKLFGYRLTTLLGGCLIVLGHFILAIGGPFSLYIGLGCLVVGVVFFKSNALSLLGEFYHEDRAHRQIAFNFYYAGGSLGGFFAPIFCGWVAHKYGWHWGFILAGTGMVIGLIVMLMGYKYFIGKGDHKALPNQQKPIKWLFPLVLIVFIGIFVIFLYELLAGWVLLVIGVITIMYVVRIHLRCDKKMRVFLRLFYVLMITETIFWAFDQQMGSSINLFISRNIDKIIHFGKVSFEIPTPIFQAINPFIILLCTPLVSYIWIRLAKKKKIHISSVIKLVVGFLLITFGFCFIFLGEKFASISGQANMLWVIVGLMLVGVAEIFIDPVAIAYISSTDPKESLSIMIATYYLFTGAIANYIAAQIAKLSSLHLPKKATLIEYAKGYEDIYFKIAIICLIILFV